METLSFDRADSESTDPDEKSVLRAAVPVETAVTVSPTLPLWPLRAPELELTAGAPPPCAARAITGELEPLIQTIPDPVLGPPGLIPDPEVPEVVAGKVNRGDAEANGARPRTRMRRARPGWRAR